MKTLFTEKENQILESVFPYIFNFYMAGYSLEDSIKMGYDKAQELLKEVIDCKTDRSIKYREMLRNQVLNGIIMK